MTKHSAGILPYRRTEAGIEVFLVHPGGPFFTRKDLGAWTIPKGELADNEKPIMAAEREFAEETSFTCTAPYISLGTVRQAGGKVVHGFAHEAGPGLDPARIVSATFELEWPPNSGQLTHFPEIDRASWFSLADAAKKINAAQVEFLQRLKAAI